MPRRNHPSHHCVTHKVGHTSLVPFLTTYGTGMEVATTVPGHEITAVYDTTCPALDEGPCYTIYTTKTFPPHVEWVYVYTVITTSAYSSGAIFYSYSTSCPVIMPKRSPSNDQATVTPGVVGVARALGIMVVLLGLLIYFLFKRATSRAPRRLRVVENNRTDNYSVPYDPMEADQYVQDEHYSQPPVQLSRYTKLGEAEANSDTAKALQQSANL